MKIYGVWNNCYERLDDFFMRRKDAEKFVDYMNAEHNIPKEEMPITEVNVYKKFKDFKKDFEGLE